MQPWQPILQPMPAQPSPALSQPLAALAIATPLLNNYVTNCNRSLEDMEVVQMVQGAQEAMEDQADQADQADPTNQTQLPLNNPSYQPQMWKPWEHSHRSSTVTEPKPMTSSMK